MAAKQQTKPDPKKEKPAEPMLLDGFKSEYELECFIKMREKIQAVASEIGKMPKTGYNNFHKYHYVTESGVSEAFVPLGVEHKLDYVKVPIKHWREDNLWFVEYKYYWIDLETGYILRRMPGDEEDFKIIGVGQDNNDKGYYKAESGADKYIVLKTFHVASGGDDPERDHDGQGQKPKNKGKQPDKKQDGTINKGQQTYIHRTAKSKNIPVGVVKEYLKKLTGEESTSNITLEQFEEVKKWLNTWKTPESKNSSAPAPQSNEQASQPVKEDQLFNQSDGSDVGLPDFEE